MRYIDVKGLTFYYDDEPVLEDISYFVEDGEFVILTGENGAAKSTLIKARRTKAKCRLYSTTDCLVQCRLSKYSLRIGPIWPLSERPMV